jgi:uncharacterized protein DUF5979
MIKFLERTRFVAVALAGALLVAGCIDINVTKKTTGGTSTGPFTVLVSCKTGSTTTSKELTFNGEDTKTASFTLPAGATCTITETESAGATSVTYTCDKISPNNLGVTCTQKADGLEVVVPDDLGPLDEVDVDVTVTNDFTPPPTQAPTTAAAPTTTAAPAPAAPVEAAATFTG